MIFYLVPVKSEKAWEVFQLFQVNLPLSRERKGGLAWRDWVQAAGQGHTAEREGKRHLTGHRENGKRQQQQRRIKSRCEGMAALTDIFVSLLRMTWRRWGGSIGGALRCSSGLKMYCCCPYGPGGELERSANKQQSRLHYWQVQHLCLVSINIYSIWVDNYTVRSVT